MSIPLNKLIDYQDNIYEITSVAIKEAEILSDPEYGRGAELEKNNGKIVSEVLSNALNGEIAFEGADGR